MSIGYVDKMDFIERYVGLMSDFDMAFELHISINEVRELRNEFSQKCWTCRNACNSNNCLWVKNHIYPPYVTIADDGHIIDCERYEDETRQFI